MADYPTSIFEPRTTQNLPGIDFDPLDTVTNFAEDYSLPSAEIVAIEETLGLNPQGDETTVADRLDAIEAGTPALGGVGLTPLYSDVSTIALSAVGVETTLRSYTLLANTLANEGDYIDVTIIGRQISTDPADEVIINVYFGGDLIDTDTLVNFSSPFVFKYRIFRRNTGGQIIIINHDSNVSRVLTTKDLSTNNVIHVTGEKTDIVNDVCEVDLFSVDLYRSNN